MSCPESTPPLCACGCGRPVQHSHKAGRYWNLYAKRGCHLRGRGQTSCIRHGRSNDLTYKSWQHMWQRCTNPNTDSYRHYGQRGISVYEPWRDFAVFLKDMGERPSKRHSIDRIDGDGPYHPENCRWVLPREQHWNRAVVQMLTVEGVSLPATQWARRIGLTATTIRRRLKNGWTPYDAVHVPALPYSGVGRALGARYRTPNNRRADD